LSSGTPGSLAHVSRFEVVPTSDEVGIIGAALNAERASSAS
jgi:hypothetical protein